MMNPSGTKFSGVKMVSHSDLRAGTLSDRIIKKEDSRIATWNITSLGVCDKHENIKIDMKPLNIYILGMSEIKWKYERDFSSDNYGVFTQVTKQQYRSYNNINQGMGTKGKNYLLLQLRNYAYEIKNIRK